MRLEVQYTEADLNEAQREAMGQPQVKPKRTLSTGLVGWFMFMTLLGALWWLLKRGRPGQPAQPQGPGQDLLVTVLPNVFLALAVLGIVLGAMVATAAGRRAAFGQKTRTRTARAGGFFAIFPLVLIAVAIAAGEGLPEWQWRPSRFEAVLVAFIPWLSVVFMLWIAYGWYSKEMKRLGLDQNPALWRPHVLEFSDAGATSNEEHEMTLYRWSAFVRYRESEKLYILVLENINFLMVPKRAFADRKLELEFRVLIQAKIKEGYFLPPPQGAFEVLPPPPLPSR